MATTLAVGCGQPSTAPGWRTAFRVVEDLPSVFLEKTELLEAEAIETWRFRGLADLVPWEPVLIDERFEQRGLDLR